MKSNSEPGLPEPRASNEYDERISRRRFAELEVTLRGTTGNSYAGVIENISENGCMVSILDSGEPSVGRMVSLKFKRTIMIGRIVWCRSNKVGVRFVSPINSGTIEEQVELALACRLSRAKFSYGPIANLPSSHLWDD